jgi:hypothetical protein
MVLDFTTQLIFFGKLLFVLGLGIYTIFAAVVIRQVYIMTNSLEVGFEDTIRLFAWIHFGISLVLFFVVLLFL